MSNEMKRQSSFLCTDYAARLPFWGNNFWCLRAEAFNTDGPLERTALSPGGIAFPESAHTWKGDRVPFRRGMVEACEM